MSRVNATYILRRKIVQTIVNMRCTACIRRWCILALAFPDILQSSRRGEMTARKIILRAWKKRSNDCISEVELQLDLSWDCLITFQLTPRKKMNGRVIAQPAYVNSLSSLRMCYSQEPPPWRESSATKIRFLYTPALMILLSSCHRGNDAADIFSTTILCSAVGR